MTRKICVSGIREKIRKAIIKKCREDPMDRFRILYRKDNVIDVQVQWDEIDLEILSVKI